LEYILMRKIHLSKVMPDAGGRIGCSKLQTRVTIFNFRYQSDHLLNTAARRHHL
jgi:hypothetical protein